MHIDHDTFLPHILLGLLSVLEEPYLQYTFKQGDIHHGMPEPLPGPSFAPALL